MRGLNNNDDFENFNMGFSEEESGEEISLPLLDLNTTPEDTLAILLSGVVSDQEHFKTLYDVLILMGSANLFPVLNRMNGRRSEMWEKVKSYSDLTTDQRYEYLYGYTRSKDSDVFAALQRSFYVVGHDGVNFSFNPSNVDLIPEESQMRDIYGDGKECVKFAFHSKNKLMQNSRYKILECFPPDKLAALDTVPKKERAFEELLTSFIDGNLKYVLDANKFVQAKEPGACLPHTLSVDGWVGESLSTLLRAEFGSVLILFGGADNLNVNRAAHSSYLMVSYDESSPYYITHSPSIFIDDVVKDDNTGQYQWEWRRCVAEKSLEVKGRLASTKNVSAEQREKELKLSLYEAAVSSAPKGSKISQRYGHGIMKGPLAEKLGTKHFISCYSRKLSKKQTVMDNPTYVHVVKKTVARDSDFNGYVKIVLADNLTVALIPNELWSKSRHAKSGGNASNYFTRFGKALGPGNLRVDLFYALYCCAQTKLMFDSFRSGKIYDPHVLTDKIKGWYDKKNVYSKIFIDGSLKSVSKGVNGAMRCLSEKVMGFYVEALSMRKGQNSMKNLKSNNGDVFADFDFEEFSGLPGEWGLGDDEEFVDDYQLDSSHDDDIADQYHDESGDGGTPFGGDFEAMSQAFSGIETSFN